MLWTVRAVLQGAAGATACDVHALASSDNISCVYVLGGVMLWQTVEVCLQLSTPATQYACSSWHLNAVQLCTANCTHRLCADLAIVLCAEEPYTVSRLKARAE